MEKSRARNRHTHPVQAITAIVSAPKGSAAQSPSQSSSNIVCGGVRIVVLWECRLAALAMMGGSCGIVSWSTMRRRSARWTWPRCTKTTTRRSLGAFL